MISLGQPSVNRVADQLFYATTSADHYIDIYILLYIDIYITVGRVDSTQIVRTKKHGITEGLSNCGCNPSIYAVQSYKKFPN